MEIKYQVEITRIVDGKENEYLLGYVNSLDELINDIDNFVERMKPISMDPKNEDEASKIMAKLLQSKK